MTWLPYYGAHLKLKEFVTEDLSHVFAIGGQLPITPHASRPAAERLESIVSGHRDLVTFSLVIDHALC